MKKEGAQFYQGLVSVLIRSLQERLERVFCYRQMLSSEANHVDFPFGDNIYVIATTGDPRFAFQWVNEDVSA